MVNVSKATATIGQLSILKFFPSDLEARVALVGIVCQFADDNEKIEWLVRRALVVFNEWPGPRELRALYCSRWKPADGAEAHSMLYPTDEGGGWFPRDPALPAPAPLIPLSEEESRRLLQMAAEPIERPAPAPRRAEPPPVNPNFKPITQTDIDRAVAELRERRAREANVPAAQP